MKVTSLFQEIVKKFIDALDNIQSINDDEFNSAFEKHKGEFMKGLIDLQSHYPLLTHHNLSAFNTDPKKMLGQVILIQQTGDCDGFLPSGFSFVFDFDKFKVCQPAVIDISEKPHVFIPYHNEDTINDLQEFLLNILLSHPLGKAHISVVTFDRGVLLPHLTKLPDSIISKVSNMVECNMIGDNIIKKNEGYVQFKDDFEAITEYVVLIGHPHSFSSQTLIDTYKYILQSKQSRNAHIILVDLYKTESFSSVFPLDNCHKIVVSENIHDVQSERLINNPTLLSDCLAYLGKYEGERHVVEQTTQDSVDFLSKECAELSKQNRKQLDHIRELEAKIELLQKELADKETENRNKMAEKENVTASLRKELRQKENELRQFEKVEKELKDKIEMLKKELEERNSEIASQKSSNELLSALNSNIIENNRKLLNIIENSEEDDDFSFASLTESHYQNEEPEEVEVLLKWKDGGIIRDRRTKISKDEYLALLKGGEYSLSNYIRAHYDNIETVESPTMRKW